MTSWALTGCLVRYLKQFRYIKQGKIHNKKVHRHKKSLFIPIGLHSVTISDVINYSTGSSLKKKKGKRKEQKKEAKEEGEGKGRGGKEEKKKRDGRSLCGRKGKRENERWQKRGKEEEGEEMRERERGT